MADDGRDNFTLYPGGPDLPFNTPSWLGGDDEPRRVADNLRRPNQEMVDQWTEQASRFPYRPSLPVGLSVTGNGVMMMTTPPDRNMAQDANTASTSAVDTTGRNGAYAAYFAELEGEIDNARISRYFGDLSSGYGSAYDTETGQPQYNPANYEAYLNESLLETTDQAALDLTNTEDDLILNIVGGGGGIRGMYDRAIQLSFDDPEAFTVFQMQLVQHGFMSGQPNFGEMDDATAAALQSMIDGKIKVGDDLDFTSYLARARTTYFDRTFEEGFGDLEAADAETAASLRSLREQIDNMDITVNLSHPEEVKRLVQQQAMNTMGRRLSDEEMSGIVDGVHEEERAEFYRSNPAFQQYNELVRQWEDAVTNVEERRASVLGGQDGSDLDEFMNAIMHQESGGQVDAVNPHSGAFGLYQFMPGTWSDVTRNAGLDPNDKSEENQTAAARYLMASYFRQFGNWRDVAIAWYAGPGGVKYSNNALSRGQADNHPSINQYADEIVARMDGTFDSNVDLNEAVDLDLTGLTPQLIQAYLDGKYTPINEVDVEGGQGLSDLDGELSATLSGSGPNITENTGFDIQSYLESAVNEGGGVEVDAYNYATRAMQFYDLLGRR